MRLSLYVPCYNGAPWLDACLSALLDQTTPADEVLVVDDGSTDQSAAIAQRFAPRVRLVSHPRNQGLAVARNTALTAARGEIVASVDADVRASSTWLAQLLGAFHSPRVVVAGGCLVEAHQTRLADRWRAVHMAQNAGDFPLQNPPALPGANVAVRRDVVLGMGGYDVSFHTNYEDADLQHRLQAAGYHSRYEPGAVAYHLRTDTAASVLRTYWSWLRPPFERQGAFGSAAGLETKGLANAEFARRALWRDLAGGDEALSYLSLLVMLAFPAADRAHAARRAEEAGNPAADAHRAAAAAWVAQAPRLLLDRSPALAARLGADLASLAWWPDGASAGDASIEPALVATGAAIAALPRAWWPTIEAARERLAAEEGWPAAPATLDAPAAMRPVEASGRSPIASSKTPPPSPTSEQAEERLAAEAAWLARAAGVDALAVVLHGALGRGEDVDWAPLELLLVVRQELPGGTLDQLRDALVARLRRRVILSCTAAHRLGWLSPSPLQQSLHAGAVLLWGSPAARETIPGWPPERLDPRLALDEMAGARADLAAGRARLAVARAAGALLIARRAYTPRFDARRAALRATWPEAPDPADVSAATFVARADTLIKDWLFTWENQGPGALAVARFEALRHRSREQSRDQPKGPSSGPAGYQPQTGAA